MDDPTVAHPVALHDGAPDPVAEVLAAVDGLDGRPVAEHVAVLEHAHESLRRVLAGDPVHG